MIAAGKSIKTLCPDLLHVSCVAHCLNRVAENVRELHPLTDSFLGKFKEVLRCNLGRKQKFKQMTGLPLPPKPVITRWTTWLQAAEYLTNNIEKISMFINSLKSTSVTVRNLKAMIADEDLNCELLSLTDFYFLIEATNKLQAECAKLSDSFSIIKDAGSKLDECSTKGPATKFAASLSKNPDLERLCTEKDLAFRLRMKFAPIVSVDVERSFSLTKKILASDRCSFTEQNLRMHYVIAFNSFITQ